MKRDLIIAGLSVAAVLMGLLLYSSYTTITSAGKETRDAIEQGEAAMERFREAERQRQNRIDTHL